MARYDGYDVVPSVALPRLGGETNGATRRARRDTQQECLKAQTTGANDKNGGLRLLRDQDTGTRSAAHCDHAAAENRRDPDPRRSGSRRCQSGRCSSVRGLIFLRSNTRRSPFDADTTVRGRGRMLSTHSQPVATVTRDDSAFAPLFKVQPVILDLQPSNRKLATMIKQALRREAMHSPQAPRRSGKHGERTQSRGCPTLLWNRLFNP